jgi:hypothetical protein
VAPREQGEVPPQRQPTGKRLLYGLYVLMGIISFTGLCAVIAFAIQTNQYEEKSVSVLGSAGK